MKAGAALGLLAGLGALNALGGGRNGTGKRFTGLMDMLDGGGAGASGDRFEGGGLLSILGNLFAKPLEAQDNVERIAADTNATKAVTKTLEDMAKGGTLTSRLDGKDFPMQYSGRGNVGMPRSGMEYSGRGLLAGSPEEMQYSGRGNVGMPRSGMEYSGRGMLGMPAENVMANVESPVATGASSAAQNEANKAQMRINMGGVTRDQYDAMTNAEKRERGLPVGGLDLAFAGSDAFAQPMQYSGRGMSSGDPEYDAFVNMVKDDAAFTGIMDNPVALRNIFNMYKQQMGM
jgi:hypothetical protein